MSTLTVIFKASLAVVVVALIWQPAAAASGPYQVKPVDDPLSLPYRFNVYSTLPFHDEEGQTITGKLVPIPVDLEGSQGCYIVENNWRPRSGFSCLLFYPDVKYSAALAHLNISTPRIISDFACDLDGDGLVEVAITYATSDSLWLEIKDILGTNRRNYRRFLLTGNDLNGDGYWDGGGFVCAAHDFTDDGYQELIVTSDVGYDLYPRLIYCLDWHSDSLLWQFEMSGFVGPSNVHIVQLAPDEPSSIIVSVSSKGNSAVVGDMSDAHSYLLVLTPQGKLRWKKTTGDTFCAGPITLIDRAGDGELEILSAQRFDLAVDPGSGVVNRHGWLRLYDRHGQTIDSTDLGPNLYAHQLATIDLDCDGVEEIAACLEDKTLVVFNQNLEPQLLCEFYAKVDIWGVADYLGSGDNQFLLQTLDRKLWLFDQEFRPLAQLTANANRSLSTVYWPPSSTQSELVLTLDGGQRVSLVEFASTPWTLVFYRRPWLAFLVAFVPLSLALIVLTLWTTAVRRQHRLQAESRAREAAYAAHKSLIASIGHRLRNSMALATLNSQALLARHTAELPEKPRQLLQQIGESLELTNQNITALSSYERVHQEIESGAVDVIGVATGVIEAYRPLIDAHKITIGLKGGEGITVPANQKHIYFLFDTLVKNGIEACTGVSEPRIDIELLPEADVLRIIYTDNGCGLDPETQRKLGRSIVSTKPTTGLGIGVLSTFEMVNAYGGSIVYENRVDKGVQVTVVLPRQPAEIK